MAKPRLEKVSYDEAAAIIAGDLSPELPHQVREALLEVVLAWANLDMASAFFVSLVSELDPDDGAKKFGRTHIEVKLAKSAKILLKNNQKDLAKEVQEIADRYQERSFYRRRIAHSKCAGVRKTNPNRVIFLPYETEGHPGHLALEIFDLALFHDAIDWAKNSHDRLMEYVDGADFFGVRRP